jgi:hypothetical protein
MHLHANADVRPEHISTIYTRQRNAGLKSWTISGPTRSSPGFSASLRRAGTSPASARSSGARSGGCAGGTRFCVGRRGRSPSPPFSPDPSCTRVERARPSLDLGERSVLQVEPTRLVTGLNRRRTTSLSVCGPATLTVTAMVAVAMLVVAPAASGHVTNALAACHLWPDTQPLQRAVNSNSCVELRPGVYRLRDALTLPSNHTLTALASNANKTVLKAVTPWAGTWQAVVTSNGSNAALANLTVDANHLSIGGVGARGVAISGVRVLNARCWGIGIAGPGLSLTDSIIEKNGANCPTAPPGAGIYADGRRAEGTGSNAMYKPEIDGNVIRRNTGPGVDVNEVWGGTFTNNDVYGNTTYAGVSLYGAGKWTIAYNTIRHPATDSYKGSHQCGGGPGGRHSSGLFLCEDTDDNNVVTVFNFVHDNAISSWYGILLIGNDPDRDYLIPGSFPDPEPYLVPRYNLIIDNDVHGSNYGCADDYRPGQWYGGDNTWVGNNCNGTPNSGPGVF